jgi:hypothetical protein
MAGINSQGIPKEIIVFSQYRDPKGPAIPLSLLPVPVNVFPAEIQSIILALSEAHGTQPEVAVIALLAIAGSLIGWSRRLIAKEGWYIHASLYAAIAAETGEGKSPTTAFLIRPIEKLEHQEYEKYKAVLEEHITSLETWKVSKKEARGEKPEPPLRKRFKLGDCTVEALADGLDGNPKGLLWYRDELNGLFLDLDKYTGKVGSTKSKLLEAYDLKAWQVDRVNNERTSYIPKACLGVFGTIQPKILSQAFDDLDSASGFLSRFIIIHSTKTGPTLWSEAGISKKLGETWSRYVQKLASYELDFANDDENNFESRLVKLSEDAKNQYIAWYNQIALQPWNNIEDGFFRPIVPKMEEQALRICLILHCLESIAFVGSETLPVQGETMRRALKLADWVWSHQKWTWSLLNRHIKTEYAPIDQRIAAAIVELELEISNSILLTSKITEQLNKGLDEKYHISPKSVGRSCSSKLKLQKAPDKNKRGWIVTPDTITHLKSVFGITDATNALNACNAQIPHQPEDTGTGVSFTNARNAQENTGVSFKCPTNASPLNPHQTGEKGIKGIKGVYLPEISNNPNIANQSDIFDNPPGNPEWQESLNSLIETKAPPEDDPGREIFEL